MISTWVCMLHRCDEGQLSVLLPIKIPPSCRGIMAHLWIFLKAVFFFPPIFFFCNRFFFAVLIFPPVDDSWNPIWCLVPAADVFRKSSKSWSLSVSSPLSSSSCLPPDKFWYCRLSPNHKVLHYGDLEESPQGEVPHDSLQDKRECQGKRIQISQVYRLCVCVYGQCHGIVCWFWALMDLERSLTF